MDVSNPIRSVIPSVHGDVLAVLARTAVPLSGRGVASLAEGVSRAGVQKSLTALAEAGIVLVEHRPPVKLYRLNRQHLASDAIVELATIRQRLFAQMRQQVAGWRRPPWGVWLFGSTARGDGSTSSDIDVLIVRPVNVADDDPEWLVQVDSLSDDVTAWTGNPCRIVEYSHDEFNTMLAEDQRLIRELRTDGIALGKRRIPRQARMTSSG